MSNTIRRQGVLLKWKPKKWRPEYERIVLLSCLGWANKRIAAELGFTKEYVSVILNLDEADVVREQILAKMRERTVVSVSEDMEAIATKGLKRLRRLVEDDDLFEKAPMAIIDRSLDVAKGLGHFKKGEKEGGLHIDKAIFIPNDKADSLFAGLQKANEVRNLANPE